MTVKFVSVLEGEQAKTGWELYKSCFEQLDQQAANRHLMFRSEFDEVLADPRIDKVLTLDGEDLVGLATFTRHLEAVPLIAPAFYEHRWPRLFAEQRIWYIGFVAVTPNRLGAGAFLESFAEFYRIAAAERGLVAMDICAYNEQLRRLPDAIAKQLGRLSAGAAKCERSDAQSFWTFDMTGDHL